MFFLRNWIFQGSVGWIGSLSGRYLRGFGREGGYFGSSLGVNNLGSLSPRQIEEASTLGSCGKVFGFFRRPFFQTGLAGFLSWWGYNILGFDRVNS